MEAKTFTHLVPTRVPSFDAITEKKFRPSLTVRRITLIMNALNVNAERVRALLSAFGETVQGTDYLAPKHVPQTTIQQWLSGRCELPLHRAAQIVMILEAAMVEQEANAREQYEADDPAFLLYETVRKIIGELEKDDQLRLLTDRFRLTMWSMLRKGMADKTVEKSRFENYRKYILSRGITWKFSAAKVKGQK